MPYRAKVVHPDETAVGTEYEDLEDRIAEVLEGIADGDLVSVSHGFGSHGSWRGSGSPTLTAVIVWWED